MHDVARARAGRTTSWSAAGLLCDMDGTLVDSAAVIDEAWTEVAVRHDLPRSEVLAALPGRTARDILALFLSDAAMIAEEVARVERRQLVAAGVREIPGARRLLSALHPDRWAVVTAAPESVARARLDAAGLPAPGVLVAAGSVTHGKPSPEGFLLAAERLGLPGGRCVVLEDSAVGVTAGHAAGARVVGVGPGAHEADARVPDLRSFTDIDVTGEVIRWSLAEI
ncbi:HAD-IA family hydrolase [Antribacter sp. KLBMP9083]|uniref:HAD-IA family hydrolase n=1 Tax=Antribacter soli TaxID=2910976 RepID=A0AA41QJT9_9MICO|nr:HAD-IA family hydrolase [Antribacter soli]MCF4123369.1 HAD-IA family hydrolase [Antribacter soli]